MTENDPRRSPGARHPLDRLTVGQRFAALTAQVGLVLGVAAAIGGRGLLAIATIGVFLVIGLIGFIPGELASARRAVADERQRLMQYEAIAWSGYLIRPVIMVGAVVELYRGTPGPFVLIGTLGSVAEVAAVLLLPRLR